ncbi:unnamed protein product, partial [Iphiclides podalirius]
MIRFLHDSTVKPARGVGRRLQRRPMNTKRAVSAQYLHLELRARGQTSVAALAAYLRPSARGPTAAPAMNSPPPNGSSGSVTDSKWATPSNVGGHLTRVLPRLIVGLIPRRGHSNVPNAPRTGHALCIWFTARRAAVPGMGPRRSLSRNRSLQRISASPDP